MPLWIVPAAILVVWLLVSIVMVIRTMRGTSYVPTNTVMVAESTTNEYEGE